MCTLFKTAVCSSSLALCPQSHLTFTHLHTRVGTDSLPIVSSFSTPFPTEMRFHLGRDLCLFYDVSQASLVAQMVKNLPLVWETQVWFLGWEDPLEKRMATHSGMLAGEFHGQRILAGYSPWGHKELWCSWVTKHSPAAIDYHFTFFRHLEHCLVQIRYLIHIYWMNEYMNMHCARL